jgi:hypothetical protein
MMSDLDSTLKAVQGMVEDKKTVMERPEALRIADLLERDPSEWGGLSLGWKAAAELRRLLSEALRIEGIAYEQQSVIYGLRLSVLNLQHNNEVLTNALWKACGDDEQVVNDTIESQGTLR